MGRRRGFYKARFPIRVDERSSSLVDASLFLAVTPRPLLRVGIAGRLPVCRNALTAFLRR